MNYLNVRKVSFFFSYFETFMVKTLFLDTNISYYCKKEALNFDILRFYCIFAEQISKSIENLKV